MRFRDTSIRSIGELVSQLKTQVLPSDIVWFRGQSRKTWSLVPSLGRPGIPHDIELALIKRFKQNALAHISPRPDTEWEWLFLMQHHHLPTRLLDWTESPLAAMFFAVQQSSDHEKQDGAIWCLLPCQLNRCANVEFPIDRDVPAFDHDPVLDNYLPTTISRESTSQLLPLAAIACRNSARIVAQHGTFTITHRKMTAIDSVGDKKHIWRFTIPASAKKRLREELKILHFTELSLFPELDRVALDARSILV